VETATLMHCKNSTLRFVTCSAEAWTLNETRRLKCNATGNQWPTEWGNSRKRALPGRVRCFAPVSRHMSVEKDMMLIPITDVAKEKTRSRRTAAGWPHGL